MNVRPDYLIVCLKEGAAYIPFTLKIACSTYIVFVILAFVFASIRFYKIPVLSKLVAGFVTIYMGIPDMLALNIYYLLGMLYLPKFLAFFHLPWTIKDIDFAWVAVLALSLGSACWLSEIFRGAYKAIPQIQFEAGYSIGLTKFQTLRRIIIPQIFATVLPALINWFITNLKNTSLVTAIGIIEVMGGCLGPCKRTYNYFEGYVAAAVIYWMMVIVVERFGKRIEKYSTRYRRNMTC